MENSFSEKYLPLLRSYWLPLLIGVCGLIFLAYGLMPFGRQKEDKQDMLFEAASNDASVSADQKQETKKITVDIEGAVLKPGVYQLASESRIQDALVIAGGLAPNADRAQIAKGLNLAAKVTDGTKLYIPPVGEHLASSTGGGQAVLGTESGGSGQINLNSASEKELDSLPGVGAVTTAKIIAGRPYSAIEELVQKKIVGQKVFEQIKEKITLY